jgi:uncharacterized protein
MIKVLITHKTDGSFVSLEAKGHANSAPKGEDLVCAAVSGILLGGFNALDEQNFSAKAEEGYALLSAKKPVSEHDAIVIETLLKQLESLADSHPENVKLERKIEK